jgi:hypothetical protein
MFERDYVEAVPPRPRTSYGVRQAMLFELLAFSKSVLDQFWLWRTQRGLRSIAKYLPPKASYKG